MIRESIIFFVILLAIMPTFGQMAMNESDDKWIEFERQYI